MALALAMAMAMALAMIHEDSNWKTASGEKTPHNNGVTRMTQTNEININGTVYVPKEKIGQDLTSLRSVERSISRLKKDKRLPS